MKRPGRPRIDPDNESVGVAVRLPTPQYDRVYAEAQRDQVSIAEVIRRRLSRSGDDEPADD